MSYFDSEFSTKTINQHNPFNSLTTVNGFLVPQHMVKEKEEEKEVLDKWELKVADILGISKLQKEKKYSEIEKFDLLEVTPESLLAFHTYLDQYLIFPFQASIEQETGPFEVTEFDVNCIQFGQEIVVDEFYGIIVECRLGRKKAILPLAEIDVEEENPNYPLIDDYQTWFWNCR